jgi:ATP-dependent Lhr-like helicase
LPDHPVCPKCGSSRLGVLRLGESKVQSLVDKGGEKLTKVEQKINRRAIKTAKLVSKYGKNAVVAISGRIVQFSDVIKLLGKENRLSNNFFELIIEAEKKSLKRKFW